MRQTLFFIPHWVFEGPMLVSWLVLGALVFAFLYKRQSSSDALSFLPVYLVVALAIHFVLPNFEVVGLNSADPLGDPIKLGLAIRGYGIFLLLGIVSGVLLALSRCEKIGVSVDDLIGLAFWMMVFGIAGARVFYVIQKSDDFFTDATVGEIILKLVMVTQGGLVVYGSLIGATMAGFVYMKLNKLPVLKTADLIAPSMVLGLAIGRLGCLMNGCCFGGVCDAPLPAVTFPPGSGPYLQQLSKGELIGVRAEVNEDPVSIYSLNVKSVDQPSIAADLGLVAGDEITVSFSDVELLKFQKQNPDFDFDGKTLSIFIDSKQHGRLVVPVNRLPARSRDTHPAQIYSSINAALLCLVLWSYWTMRRSDGEVFALMLILYSIGRFLMELIRQDELGQFGTDVTISQWVSLAAVVIGLALFVYARITSPPNLKRPSTSLA